MNISTDIALTTDQAWRVVDRCIDGTTRMLYRAGAALIEAKAATPHGEWLDRLTERGISEDAAQRWMRVAREMTEAEFLEAGSLRGALAELAEPQSNTARVRYSESDIDDGFHGDEPDTSPADAPETVGGTEVSFDGDERVVGRQMRPVSRHHPATYTDGLMPIFADIITQHLHYDFGTTRILDPMAGEGGIHLIRTELQARNRRGIYVEASDIHQWPESPWQVRVADATNLDTETEAFDVIVTSPPYGNRMADKLSTDGDNRVIYADRRGHDAGPTDTSGMQWGDAYRTTMAAIWAECWRVLRTDGLLILNCKDFIRDHRWIDVTGWHVGALTRLGLEPVAFRHLAASGVGGVDNAEARTGAEYIVAFRKPNR